ncbi:MAG: hypothetical protein ACKVS9_05045 [Phycisphaerae bacterium]
MKRESIVLGVAAWTASVTAFAQTPLGTVFTYQGQLKESGSPASGLYDIRFQLFLTSSGGLPLATSCADDVNVDDGLFTASVDFGQQYDGNERWVQIEVRPDAGPCASGSGYTLLTTRQRLSAVPYALKVPGIDGHSLNAADGSPLDAVFVDVDGRTGMGTLTPQARLDVIRDWDGQDGAIRVGGDRPSVRFQGGPIAGSEAWLMHVGTDGPGALQFFRRSGASWQNRMTILPSGNVGIGTINPQGVLDLAAGTSSYVRVDSAFGDLHVNGGTDGIFSAYNEGAAGGRTEFIGQGIPRMAILNTGNVGIGTTSPTSKLEIAAADGLKITGFQPYMTLVDTNAGNARGRIQSAAGDVLIYTESGIAASVAPLRVRNSDGATIVKVLEITGADLAEKFPSSEKLEPGMVTAIDAANAGKLCLARGEYNRCVAGVVSGANDFAVGAVLGNLPGSEDAPPIALSGRVYVWCDASSGSIQPGDLLTTSDTPGHAMRAVDRDRSHGAVIGKAMESLESGRGMVLVLVNLQ